MKDWNFDEDNSGVYFGDDSGEDFEEQIMPSCDYDLSEFCEDEFSRMTGCTVNCALYLKSIEQMNKMNIAINRTTLIGVGVIEVSKILTFIGCYFLYIGNKG